MHVNCFMNNNNNNIQKSRFSSRKIPSYARYILAALVVISMFVFSFFLTNINSQKPSAHALFGEESFKDIDTGYDYILVIDESGSMKKNDPQDLRKDAAKLFVYLAEAMNKGNRVLISGFGEVTNIYAPLTDISGNEKYISEAIDKIKSDQDLTDMKGALEKIKQMLDTRIDKKKTVVIFLTDGSLTLDDIPPEKIKDKDKKPSREKPGRPKSPDEINKDVRGDKYNSLGGKNDGREINAYSTGTLKETDNYLENYKKELINLCYKYADEGIIIHPIAFTKETDIKILEQMAYITGGVCWKPEKAADLRTSFIEILKNITNRFIKIEEQIQAGSLKGKFTVYKYIKELIVIGLKSDYQNVPQIKLTDSSGSEAQYDEYVEENIFKIAKVKAPAEGEWNYEINGDGIFAYDILNALAKEPQYSTYTADAQIPLKIDISEILNQSGPDIIGDFKVSAKIEDPEGRITESTDFIDDGAGSDNKASDGIFTGKYGISGLSGYYTVTFLITNMPTGAISSKSLNFEAVKFPVSVKVIEPSKDYYALDSEIRIAASLEPNGESGKSFELKNYELTIDISDLQGKIVRNLALLDNGKGADEQAGDGIYSASFSNTSSESIYNIDYFIRDITKMDIPACTGLSSVFELKAAPAFNFDIENNMFAGEPSVIKANLDDFGKAEFKYKLVKPDGKTIKGSLYDDGNSVHADEAAGDGIYTEILQGLDLTGQYNLSVEGTIPSEDAAVPAVVEENFNKDFKITNLPENLEFGNNIKVKEASFTILSRSTTNARLSIDSTGINNELVKSVMVKSNENITANSDNPVVFQIELKDGIKAGNYEIKIPVIIENAENTSSSDILLKISIPGKTTFYLFIIVILAGIAGIASIVVFVYFLYIKPRRRGLY